MNSKLLMAGGVLTLSAIAWAAKDPVIMTVNGVDVPKSEFEYLYKKNSQQQLEPQPLDNYVNMFAIYKMKVADAKANGLDTLPGFIKEMDQYAHELATPYLTDSVYLNKLVDQLLERMNYEAEARHIMLFKDRSGRNEPIRERMDSIRTLLRKGADFAETAKQFSQDNGSNSRGGSMGYIVAGKFPEAFERAVFETPEGKISEVFETPNGYHIVMGGKKIPARDMLLAAHIMKTVPLNASPADEAAIKAQIDSIYQVIVADPSKFEELARQYSDDTNSGQRGGALPPFRSGDMVPDFNDAAYALQNGEISTPIRTPYGYHIIKRIDSHALDTNTPELRKNLTELYGNPGGGRYAELENHELETYAKKFHPRRNEPVVNSMLSDIAVLGIDSAFVAKYSEPQLSNLTLLTVNKKPHTVAEILPMLRRFHFPADDYAIMRFNQTLDRFENNCLKEEAIVQLEKDQPEFRNLLNEYRDGSLLYEISVRRVWDKAAADKEGLAKYFEDHRDDFAWTEPHVKGYLVQAANDSVAQAVRIRLQQLPESDYLKTIRKEFKNEASIDRVLTTEGQNAMIDNLVFGASPATPTNPAYTTYFLFDQKVIYAPESVQDANVVVTNAYQNELENAWVDELKAKYPVVINDKELKKIK